MPNGAPKNIYTAKINGLEWVMVRKNDSKTLGLLKNEYFFNDIDLTDVGPPLQSSKIAYRNDYIFMILQFPIFHQNSQIIHSAEIDFFIQPSRLVTVDTVGTPDLQELYTIFSSKKQPKTSAKKIADDVPHLVYLIINTMIESLYPGLRDTSSDMEKIENRMFKEHDKIFIRELLRVKTNIVRSRQSMEGQDEILSKLDAYMKERLKMQSKLDVYFQQLIDDTRDIQKRLLLNKETIDALHETNQSLTDFRTNEIIKTLTIVSFIVFPLTLMAGVFGMNAINMPFVGHPQGFWMIIGLMFVGCLSMLAFFKYKKWM